MLLVVNTTDEMDAFISTFGKLYELSESPKDDELLKEAVASIFINNPKTSERYIVDSNGFKTTNYDYSELVIEGNGFSELEANYWNQEFFESGKIEDIIDYLKVNMMSKRAIVNLWFDDARDLSSSAPCLTYLNFRVTSEGLRMVAHMRANNAYKCLLIDLDALRALQKYVASELGVTVGEYVHFVDSLHFYRVEKAQIEALYAKIQ